VPRAAKKNRQERKTPQKREGEDKEFRQILCRNYRDIGDFDEFDESFLEALEMINRFML
jgi:hypothetical protein